MDLCSAADHISCSAFACRFTGASGLELRAPDRRNPPAANLAPRVISGPARIPELYTPIPYIIPAQLFAVALAAEKNLDPDRPLSLNKITRTL